jgi:hypothetical protein
MMFVIPMLAAVAEFALPGRSLIEDLRDVANMILGFVPLGTEITDALTAVRFLSPVHDALLGLGLLEIGVIVVIGFIHALLPIRQLDIWRPRSFERAAVFALDVAVPIIALPIMGLAIPYFVRFFQERQLQGPLGRIEVLAPALLVVALAVAVLSAGRSWTRLDRVLKEHQAIVASVSLLAAGLAAGSLVYTVVQLPEVRTWAVGSAAAFVGFQLLGAIGRWRWHVWDEREREAFRSPTPAPYERRWPAVQIALLGGLAAFAGVVVVFGLRDAVPWLLAAVATVIVVALLRDAALAASPAETPVDQHRAPQTRGPAAGETIEEVRPV